MDELLVTEQGKDNQVFRDACGVRLTVFCDEQGVHPDFEFDDLDAEALHTVVYIKDETVACGRFIVKDNVGRIGRLAVLKEHRKKGYAAKICKTYLNLAKQNNLEKVVLNAQTHAIPFYKKLGFKEQGKEFQEEGIPHISMTQEIKK